MGEKRSFRPGDVYVWVSGYNNKPCQLGIVLGVTKEGIMLLRTSKGRDSWVEMHEAELFCDSHPAGFKWVRVGSGE